MARTGGYYYGMPSRKYWKQRSKEILAETFDNAAEVEKYLLDVYRQNLLDFISEYQDIMSEFMDADGTFNKAAFRRKLQYDDTFSDRIYRLENQIEAFTKQMGKQTEQDITNLLITNYRNTLISTGEQVGANISFSLLNDKAIREAVLTPFTADGREFSDRIWSNLSDMNFRLRKELSDGIARGDSIVKTSKRLQEIFGNTAYNTQRLIRTETLATYAKASVAAYKEAGLEYLEILGEAGACDECDKNKNLQLKVIDAEVGVNIPPFHPNCKCCVMPVIK